MTGNRLPCCHENKTKQKTRATSHFSSTRVAYSLFFLLCAKGRIYLEGEEMKGEGKEGRGKGREGRERDCVCVSISRCKSWYKAHGIYKYWLNWSAILIRLKWAYGEGYFFQHALVFTIITILIHSWRTVEILAGQWCYEICKTIPARSLSST